MEDFIKRVEFFRGWIELSLKKENLPGYWLTAFFLPAGFLTAVL